MTNNTSSTKISSEKFNQTLSYIKNVQHPDGAIPWFEGGKLDPWDHTEAVMALAIGDEIDAAKRGLDWLASNQLEDGSWLAHYFAQEEVTALRETNFVAYVATGVWHLYLITQDVDILKTYQSMVSRAISFVLRYQTEEGDIAWAVNEAGQGEPDALLTACCSILRSLECAIKLQNTLGAPHLNWTKSAKKLSDAILSKPDRFDRTWESKSRFAMDWYYPVLAGLYTTQEAQKVLNDRWQAFVEPELGCRCVSDEPWVTMAETCELVIALVAADQKEKALALFQTLEQWRDEDGGYWTGYVFKDKTIWPAEKTTWTAGAVLLAADALHTLTPAHHLFTSPLDLK